MDGIINHWAGDKTYGWVNLHGRNYLVHPRNASQDFGLLRLPRSARVGAWINFEPYTPDSGPLNALRWHTIVTQRLGVLPSEVQIGDVRAPLVVNGMWTNSIFLQACAEPWLVTEPGEVDHEWGHELLAELRPHLAAWKAAEQQLVSVAEEVYLELEELGHKCLDYWMVIPTSGQAYCQLDVQLMQGNQPIGQTLSLSIFANNTKEAVLLDAQRAYDRISTCELSEIPTIFVRLAPNDDLYVRNAYLTLGTRPNQLINAALRIYIMSQLAGKQLPSGFASRIMSLDWNHSTSALESLINGFNVDTTVDFLLLGVVRAAVEAWSMIETKTGLASSLGEVTIDSAKQLLAQRRGNRLLSQLSHRARVTI